MTPPASPALRRPTSFARWLRTGFLPAEQAADPTLEVKFNPYHDPTNGQFTFGPGGAGSAGMTRPPKRPQRSKDDRSWTGDFHGGGGGSFGGGGATGTWPWPDRKVKTPTHAAAPAKSAAAVTVAHESASTHPSHSQVRKNGYTFRLDGASRTTRASGELSLERVASRSTHNQREAGRPDRRVDDDGGHFIAPRFNGPSDKFNHFAQNANFNRGSYRVMEDDWANDLRAGKHVSVTVTAHYPGSSRRPNVLEVRWQVDNGQQYSRLFINERQGKARGH